MSPYGRALQQLYRAPLASFLAERTRLSAELRAGGDEAGAKQLAVRRKPTASVWAVNQLYAIARSDFDEMLSAAARVRRGRLEASGEYHRRLAELRRRAAALLEKDGQRASETILRRIGTTLAAIGAAGGFAPDPPGALAADRDPPGFEGLARSDAGSVAGEPASATEQRSEVGRHGSAARRRRGVVPAPMGARAAQKRAEEEERARLAAERRRVATERKRRAAERRRRELEARRVRDRLRAAQAEEQRRERVIRDLGSRVEAERRALEAARDRSRELSRRLAELEESAR